MNCGAVVDAATEVCPVCGSTEFRRSENDGTSILRFSGSSASSSATAPKPTSSPAASSAKKQGNAQKNVKKRPVKKRKVSRLEKQFMDQPVLTRKLIVILASVALILVAVLIVAAFMKGCAPRSEEAPEPAVSAVVTPVPAPTVDPNAPMGQILVKEEAINIRTAPDTNAEIVDVLEKGRTYDVYEIEKDADYTWYRIGEDRWVADTNGEWMSYTGRVQ